MQTLFPDLSCRTLKLRFYSNLDRIISRVRDRENLEKKKTDQLTADKAAADKKKNEAAQPVKCGYCGTLNVATATVCKSCGASLKK